MRPLNEREKRTVRMAGIALAAYLVLFFGFQAWRAGERNRTEYAQLKHDASLLKLKLGVYAEKSAAVAQLMEKFRMDPARLSKTTVVADATAAIQTAAQTGGLGLGTIRESRSRASAEELASVQLEGTGPAPAILKFLNNLGTLGFPLVLDSIQLTGDASRPGPVKMNLTILILDYEQWKPKEVKPDA